MNRPMSSKDKDIVSADVSGDQDEMGKTMKAMRLKIHEREQKLETNKDETANKNRKTSTSKRFELVQGTPTRNRQAQNNSWLRMRQPN